MKKIMLLCVAIMFVGCAKEKVTVITNGDRVTNVERRLLLLEQVQAMQALEIIANADAIIQEKEDRAAALADLNDALNSTNVTVSDLSAALDAALDRLEATDAGLRDDLEDLRTQLAGLNPTVTNVLNMPITINIPVIIGKITLTVNHTTQQVADLTQLRDDLQDLSDSVQGNSALIAALTTRVNTLETKVDGLTTSMASMPQFVQLCSGSNEMGMRVGADLYAVYLNVEKANDGQGNSEVKDVYSGLVKLTAGTYVTTTGPTSCTFTVQ